MESYRVQQAINAGIVQGSTPKNNMQMLANGDFFAAFLQLITGENSQGLNQADILMQLGSEGLNEDDENTNESAMEMMAALLNGSSYNPLVSDSMNTLSESEIASINQALSSSENPKNLQINANFLNEMLLTKSQSGENSTLQGTMPQTQGNVLMQAMQGVLNKNESANLQAVTLNSNTEAQKSQEMQNGVIPKVESGDAKSSSETLFGGDMNFRNSVAQAQKLLKNQPNSEKTEEKSTDGMQDISNQVKAQTILPDKQVQAAPKQAVDIDDLSSQIKNNLSNGAVFDKKEFSVKLKPEGLGEVTVKLISEQNKVTLSIVTATTEAAKALNDQLPTLRETMRAMQIEVSDVVANSQDNLTDMQQSLQQQAREQHQTTGKHNHFTDNQSGTIGLLDEAGQEQVRIQGSGERMNMYI